jgi:hypothetical protein
VSRLELFGYGESSSTIRAGRGESLRAIASRGRVSRLEQFDLDLKLIGLLDPKETFTDPRIFSVLFKFSFLMIFNFAGSGEHIWPADG